MRRRAPLAFVLAASILAASVLAATGPAGSAPAGAERSTRELLRSGAIAIEEGNYARALARFREAAEIDPRLGEAQFGMGLAGLGARDRKTAEKAFRRAGELAPAVPESRYALGVTRFLFDGPKAAEADLEAAASDRYFLEARYVLGIVAALRGDLPEAATALREALRLDNGHAPAHYQLGVVLARTGDLDGALQELSHAMTLAPGMADARPDDAFVFAGRAAGPGDRPDGAGPAGTSFGMPLPVPRPLITWPARRGVSNGAPQVEVPDWYLQYYMALQLEDAGNWRGTVDLLERALRSKDRSERQAIVGGRLADYSPHLHLAEAYHQLGKFREAFLHLGIAKNEGIASPEALGALSVLIQKDRLRPRIVLQSLPDHTTEETVSIRGVIVSDEAAQRVEVAGKQAVLRPASAADTAALLGDQDATATREGTQNTLFEVPDFRLGLGSNLLAVRPSFRNPARDGDLVEVRIVRLPPPPAVPKVALPPADRPRPAGATDKPATPKPRPTPSRGAPKKPPKPKPAPLPPPGEARP
jgi:Flp pilus assembly protein TadD